MSKSSEQKKVIDIHGFHYEVTIEHSPHFGFSTALYNGKIIGQCELGRITEPQSDNDREWEMYHERYSEWRDEINSNLLRKCTEYFNNNFESFQL